MGKRVALRVLLVGLVAAGAVGCRSRPRPIQFIGILTRDNARLAMAGKAFAKTLEPLRAGTPANTGQVETTYRDIEKTLKEIKQEMGWQKAPLKSEKGEVLLAAYKKFLESQQKIFDQQVTPMYRAATGPGDPRAKWDAIAPLLGQMEQEENNARTELDQAQQEYAKEYNLQLGG